MKMINKAAKKVALRDAFKVGDTLRVHYTTLGQNAIGLDQHTKLVKLTKINRVTAIGATNAGQQVLLDWNDLRYADIVVAPEILKTNLLRA